MIPVIMIMFIITKIPTVIKSFLSVKQEIQQKGLLKIRQNELVYRAFREDPYSTNKSWLSTTSYYLEHF